MSLYESERTSALVSAFRLIVATTVIGSVLGLGARACIRHTVGSMTVQRSGGVR